MPIQASDKESTSFAASAFRRDTSARTSVPIRQAISRTGVALISGVVPMLVDVADTVLDVRMIGPNPVEWKVFDGASGGLPVPGHSADTPP
jgi:hypothetical protein